MGDHFVLVSPLHREGVVTFGDDIALRAHNGRMVSIRTEGELEAVSESLTDTSSFKLVGTAGASSGVVHSRDSSFSTLGLATLMPWPISRVWPSTRPVPTPPPLTSSS